jgi:hypothetical protein
MAVGPCRTDPPIKRPAESTRPGVRTPGSCPSGLNAPLRIISRNTSSTSGVNPMWTTGPLASARHQPTFSATGVEHPVRHRQLRHGRRRVRHYRYSFRRRGLGFRFTQADAVRDDRGFHRFAEVLPEVEAIRDLDRVRRACSCAL